MNTRKIHLWSALAALLLAAWSCAKRGESNDPTTPNVESSSEGTSAPSLDGRQWIGGGQVSAGAHLEHLNATASDRMEIGSSSNAKTTSDETSWSDGGMSSGVEQLPTGAGGSSGMGGSTGMGGAIGIGGSSGTGGFTGTGGFSGTGGGGHTASGGTITP